MTARPTFPNALAPSSSGSAEPSSAGLHWAELERLHRLATLGTLAAGIAHEINNVLTPVLAYAQLALANPEDEAMRSKALEKAMQGVETATQIVHAVLGFANAPEETPVADIQQVLDAAIKCIGRDPSKDRIRIVNRVQHKASVTIRPLALQQVLMNLILNAWEAMRQRGGEVSISAIEKSDGMTMIRVSDNGPGIPPEIAGRVFEPFVTYRPGSNRPGGSKDRREGSGLGLAICRHLIEEASGTIEATSTPGRGATFTITLPTSRAVRAKAI